MPVFDTSIAVSSNQSSPGQPVDFDGPVAGAITLTNTAPVSVQYATDGVTWVTVAAAATATFAAPEPAAFRVRKVASDSYPVAVRFQWQQSDGQPQTIYATAAQVAALKAAGTPVAPGTTIIDPASPYSVLGVVDGSGNLVLFSRLISQFGTALCLPGSGSIGNNGALTVTTAFESTFNGYFYFVANAIFAGSAAGMYWTVMSSTTAGVIYNNTYTSGNPVVPPTLVPFATTGPGAYTPLTATVYNLLTATVPANSMGTKGRIRARFYTSASNTANAKTPRMLYGGSPFWNAGLNSYKFSALDIDLWSAGEVNSQVGTPLNIGSIFGAQAQPVRRTAIDSTQDQLLTFDVSLATATDYFILEAGTVECIRA